MRGIGVQEESVNSDELGLIGRGSSAGEFNSGERMLAGGRCFAVGRTPVKPALAGDHKLE